MATPNSDDLLSDHLERLQAALGDRFVLARELGRGGMATVYLATDLKHDRPVALKVLHPGLAATLGAERFLREIHVAARLTHPHIVPVHDSGGAGEWLYYVMPFVEGESLRDRLRRAGPLPVADAVAIARDVALALDYAHRQGVVHRDIKPENILLHEGSALVADFGVAKAVASAGNEPLTAMGMAIGTPAYMSPEQAAGDADPDGRSDVFSLGATLYEMLAGEPPFSGATAQAMLTRRLVDDAPPLESRRPDVPAPLARVVATALARDPAQRPDTAARFAAALADPGSAATTVIRPAQAAGTKSIAVLPFVNMSSDPDNEFFSDGIAEEIINALSAVSALRVAARTSSFAFKGKPADIGEIGRRLRVSTVLEGSVRKAGHVLRVTAQLVDVAGGFQLWSARFDRQLEDVFAIQDEIAQSIVAALQVVLTPREQRAIERAPAADIEAYVYYLRGRQAFNEVRRTSLQLARRLFERAIDIDPAYARAYAGAADACSFLYLFWDPSRSNLEQAERYSARALELAPDLAEVRTSRAQAHTLRGQYVDAEREFRQAIDLSPNLYDAHYLFARALVQMGRDEEAVAQFKEASRVRPEDYQAGFLMATVLTRLGRDDEVDETMRHALANARRSLELNPDDSRALYLGAGGLVRLGERDQALDWGTRALAADPSDSAVLYNVACLYAMLDERDSAIDLIERAIDAGFGNRAWLEKDSDFASVRDDPRFRAALARI